MEGVFFCASFFKHFDLEGRVKQAASLEELWKLVAELEERLGNNVVPRRKHEEGVFDRDPSDSLVAALDEIFVSE